MQQSANKIVIYTDGGACNNPGPAAIGIVITAPSSKFQVPITKEYSEYIGEATNNVAEYRAVVFALKKAKQLLGKKDAAKTALEIRLDSELVARQLRGEYKLLEAGLFPWFIAIWNLKQDFRSVEFKIIPRSENYLADRLVNEVLDTEARKAR